MTKGYIKLYRCLEDNPLWLSEPFTKGQAWVDLLLMANYTVSEFQVRGIWVKVLPGQIARGEKYLAKRWTWSRNKTRMFLKWLEKEQQIEQQKTNVITVISILNWKQYQENGTTERTTEGTTERHQKGQQKDTYKKVKECKEGKEVNTMVLNTTIAKPEAEEPIKHEVKIPQTLTPIQIVVEHYKKVGGFDKVEGWDKTYFARCSCAAKKLLTLCGQKVDMAKLAISEIIKHQEAEGLSWTLETVVGRFGHWQTGKLIPSKDKRLLNNLAAGRKFIERGEKE